MLIDSLTGVVESKSDALFPKVWALGVIVLFKFDVPVKFVAIGAALCVWWADIMVAC